MGEGEEEEEVGLSYLMKEEIQVKFVNSAPAVTRSCLRGQAQRMAQRADVGGCQWSTKGGFDREWWLSAVTMALANWSLL